MKIFGLLYAGMIRRIHEKDKQQHFFYSLVLVLVSSLWFSTLIALLLVLALGVAKEIWDDFYGSGFCWYDMLANIVGIGCGWGLSVLLIS